MTQKICVKLKQLKGIQLIKVNRLNKTRYNYVWLLKKGLIYMNQPIIRIYIYMNLLLISNKKKNDKYLTIIF